MAKRQKVILLVDTSGSMHGEAIRKVKQALTRLNYKIENYKNEKVKISLHIISFKDSAKFISKNKIHKIQATGMTNLADAYRQLNNIYKAHSTFDYPPILLLLCDGCPNVEDNSKQLLKLYQNKKFADSLRLAVAYREQSTETMEILKNFAGNNVFSSNQIDTVCKIITQSLPKVIKHNRYLTTSKGKNILVQIIANDINTYEHYKYIRHNLKEQYDKSKKLSVVRHPQAVPPVNNGLFGLKGLKNYRKIRRNYATN